MLKKLIKSIKSLTMFCEYREVFNQLSMAEIIKELEQDTVFINCYNKDDSVN